MRKHKMTQAEKQEAQCYVALKYGYLARPVRPDPDHEPFLVHPTGKPQAKELE